tara:strand:- start:9000 stop:9641 length:642 start_codon:yes stop_codon:yes gene_type:complete
MKQALRNILFPKKSYGLKEIHNGHYKIEYRGIPCQKCPFDYVIYQMIIDKVKPDLIIEIGTNEGGSTLYLADLLQIYGKGQIHSIDISDKCSVLVKDHPLIKLFHDGWDQYDFSLASGFERILVIEDSSHQYKNTLGAIERFKNLVSIGSYLIVEDGIVEELGWSKSFGGGPVRAIEEFLVNNEQFTVDKYWEDYFGLSATFNTKGFLKRISK